MPDPRLLTAAELELMHVLWERGPASVIEVVEGLRGPPRAYTTVATLLKILEDKGFAAAERDGRRLVYTARVARGDYEATAVRDVVQRVFSGDAAALVRALVEAEPLDDAARAELALLLVREPDAEGP